MKCLKCGFVTSESKEVCGRCGSPLPVHATPSRASTPRAATPTPSPAYDSAPQASAGETVPDWRKEVSRKVKEYGEKKKVLTTPPRALKEHSGEPGESPAGQESHEARPDLQAANESRSRIVAAALARVEPPLPSSEEPEVARAVPPVAAYAPLRVPAPEGLRHVPSAVPETEIFASDLEDPALLDEDGEGPQEEEIPLLLGRRISALLLDHTILIVLHCGMLYLCAEIISLRFLDLLRQAWLPVAGIFVLFHCLYYSYFFKTSRQTPGMAFLGIELRDPLAGQVALRKVLLRWLALTFLNIFNLVPLLLDRNYLILDRLSGTRIRTLN